MYLFFKNVLPILAISLPHGSVVNNLISCFMVLVMYIGQTEMPTLEASFMASQMDLVSFSENLFKLINFALTLSKLKSDYHFAVGELIKADGYVFRGHWRLDRRHGQGTLFL